MALVMACHLLGAKPLSEPMMTYCQSNLKEQTLLELEWYYVFFLAFDCTRASWTVSWSVYFVYTCNKFSRVDWGIFTSNFKLMQWALLPASKMQLDSAASAINANLVRNAKCCKLIVSETGGDLFMTNNFILFAMIHLVITVYARKCPSQAISCNSSGCKEFFMFSLKYLSEIWYDK